MRTQEHFAVHGTWLMPSEGVLRAGSGLPQHFRPGAHFSLGGISPAMAASARYPFVIITRLSRLREQLVNISPADTFVLGEIRLCDDDVLVVPREAMRRKLPKANVVSYQSKACSLGVAVGAVISDLGGCVLELPQDFEIDTKVVSLGRNINEPREFASLLRAGISYGGHAASEIGRASAFGMLDRLSQGLATCCPAGKELRGQASRALAVWFARKYIDLLDETVGGMFRRGAVTDAYERQRDSALGLLESVDRQERLEEQLTRGLPTAEVLKCGLTWLTADLASVFDSVAFSRIVAELPLKALPCDRKRIEQDIALQYSVLRWLAVRNAAARAEALDQMLDANLRGIEGGNPTLARVQRMVSHRMRVASNRQREAEAIQEFLRVPGAKAKSGLGLTLVGDERSRAFKYRGF